MATGITASVIIPLHEIDGLADQERLGLVPGIPGSERPLEREAGSCRIVAANRAQVENLGHRQTPSGLRARMFTPSVDHQAAEDLAQPGSNPSGVSQGREGARSARM
jgi:hypothetical protein